MKLPYWLRALLFPLRFHFVPDDGGGSPDPLPPLINEDLSFTEGYQERVGEFAKDSTFKDLPSLFKSVNEGTRTITQLNQEKAELSKELEALKAGAAPPKLPATDAEYRQSLALPEKMPDGVALPDQLLDAVSKFALEKGVPPEVTSSFIEFQVQQAAAEFEAQTTNQFQQVEAAKAEIRSMVGAENYETTISNAKAAHDILGLNLSEADLVSNPTLVTSLAKLHAKVSPGTFRELGIGKEGETAQGKLEQARDILNNPENPHHKAFNDNTHPNHQAAVDTYNRLIAESAG